MVPQPIEGRQTPVVPSVNSTGYLPPPSSTNNISLSRLIDFLLQRTYHELSVLAELLPRKTDMERKIEIVQFASRTRQLFIRLLGLVKWAASASKVDRCASINSFLDKQAMLFIETADILSVMSRETLVNARLPSFHLPCAVEVLTLGTYSRLPTCIRDKIVPPDPITPVEKRSTLLRLNQIIQYRLVSSELPPQMRNLTIENGRVTFHVEHEFEVSLTLMGDGPHVSWRILNIDILVDDKETGDGEALVHSLQVHYIHSLIQSRVNDNSRPLHELYNCLHSFCQSLQLEVLHCQVLRLCRDRLRGCIVVDEYSAGSRLVISYWRPSITSEISVLPVPFSSLVDREHLSSKESPGCKLCVQMDPNDPSKPLQVTHVPQLNHKDAQLADQAIKSDFLSVEKLIIHTVHIRTKHKLQDLCETLKPLLGLPDCTIAGSPAVLHVPILQPCMISEELLITVDTHSGHFLAHVPQFEPPMMDDIQNCLNKDASKVENLISELRFWITIRRCEKTIQHLPALASEHLPLIIPPDHELAKFSKHRLFIKLCKHQEYYIIVRLLENPENRCEIIPTYYLMTVTPQQLDDDAIEQKVEAVLETELPKSYLKIVDFASLDNFISTHGPCTEIEYEQQGVGKKRKSVVQPDVGVKKVKYTGFFITELAHIVSMCDERIPFSTLCCELNKKDICHNGIQIEAYGSNYHVKIVQMPLRNEYDVDSFAAFHSALLSCTIRLQGKGTRTWLVEFVFCNCPVTSMSSKEQGPRRPVYYIYDFAAGTSRQVSQMVVDMIQDFYTMGHLYRIVLQLSNCLKSDQHNVYSSIMDVKSYTYKKLVLGYGPNKASTVTIYWKPSERKFHLSFGVVGQTASASNPHTLVTSQLQHEFNQHHSIVGLMQTLHDTYMPFLSISKLPSSPELGIILSRPAVPIQTFVTIPQTSIHVRIIYRNMFCLDIECRSEGLVAIRDGAYSVFDKQKAVEEFSAINSIKAFLSKFVDETATQNRRRSQTEDENPLSPVPTLDSLDGGFLGTSGQLKPGSPAQCRSQESVSSTSGPGSGLRFHLPMTPPSGSNPHTPASPHTSVLSQSYGASPNPSFSLASPPSLSQSQASHVSPSPSMLHVQAQSPGNLFAANSPANPLHVPSPSFLPTPSPSSSTAQVPMPSPAASFINQQAHGDAGSPFAAPTSTGNLSMSSPAPGAWPGSPSVPRPSPRPSGNAQSPGSSSHPALHSPQAGTLSDHTKTTGGTSTSSSRVLHCSWQAGTPTLLTHKSFDLLCSPGAVTSTQPGSPHVGQNQHHISPLERFLGCNYMRKSLGRVMQSENLIPMHTTEVGVSMFKSETLQCKVSFNPQTLQSLHLKLTANPDFKDQWTNEELQVIERYFDAKVVAVPYKPNALLAFGRILNAPLRIFKDCIHIMHLEMVPDRSLKWAIQWCLTIPPAVPQPPGMSAVFMSKDKMLFFAQLTRIGLNLAPGVEPQTVVFAAVYDIKANTTTVPDRRDAMPMNVTDPVYLITTMLKRFSDYNPNMTECSIYPAIRELMTNLVIPIH